VNVGQLSDVFPYRDVYAFLRVEKISPADTAELEKYWPVIEKTITRNKQSREWDEFVATNAGKYPMTIDTTVIDRVLADSALLFTQNFVNDDSTPVLTADGDLIFTESDLRTSASRIAMNMGNQKIRPIVMKALDDGEERLALLAAARDAGYLEDERVANRYQHSLDSALIESYLKETVVSQIKFNWAEFEEYYNENLDDFRRETQYQFDRIQVADSAKAGEVADRLADGADFNFIANLYDPNPERKEQANEWVTLGSMPGSVADDLEKMNIGDVTRPIEISDGYLVLRLRNKKLGTPRPLKDVEMRIREIIFQQKFNDLLDKTLGTLKANSHIEYRQDAIEKYFESES
jgi:parvulin-like peptidyl-prolyl isomerase